MRVSFGCVVSLNHSGLKLLTVRRWVDLVMLYDSRLSQKDEALSFELALNTGWDWTKPAAL